MLTPPRSRRHWYDAQGLTTTSRLRLTLPFSFNFIIETSPVLQRTRRRKRKRRQASSRHRLPEERPLTHTAPQMPLGRGDTSVRAERHPAIVLPQSALRHSR